MKQLKIFQSICWLSCLLMFALQLTQAQIPQDGIDAVRRNTAGIQHPVVGSTTSRRSSPFDPPEASDHSFYVDDGSGLDTGCSYRSQGPLVFNIEIKRFVGELNADGTLKNASTLVAAGLLSPKIKLVMPGFDVDYDANIPGIAPERDLVSFNGEPQGFLKGADGQWIQTPFFIDISKVKFADRGANGPTGGVNTIRIDIDTANTQEAWCTSVDWANGSFQAMSPIILIHGNNSNGAFFTRQGFTQELDSRHLVYDSSINLAAGGSIGQVSGSGGSGSIDSNAAELGSKLFEIVRSIGAKTVHLVAHSKGGLDARKYLATYGPQPDFKIISLTTLGTPHNGSVLADVAVERAVAARQVGILGQIEYEGFPAFTRQLVALMQDTEDVGRTNLTTGVVSAFNQQNIPVLSSSGTTFNTVTGDADLNLNSRIDREPDEFQEIRNEGKLSDNVFTTYGVNVLYQILRNTRAVRVRYRDECDLQGRCRQIATLTSVDNAQPLGNDTLVTIPSGHGDGSIGSLTTNRRTLVVQNGRNHSNIANSGVASTVIPWLIQVERTKGGLR